RSYRNQRLLLELRQSLIFRRQQQPPDRNRSREPGVTVDHENRVQLLNLNLPVAYPIHHFGARRRFAHVNEIGGHHSARRVLIEAQQRFHLAGLFSRQFLEHVLGDFRREISQNVGSHVRLHLLDDVRRSFRRHFLHDLRSQPRIQFGQRLGGRLLVERSDDRLPLGGREFFHNVRQVRRVHTFELVVGDPQLHPPQRVRLDQIHKLPAYGSGWQFLLDAPDEYRRSQTLQQAPRSPRPAYI